MSDAIPRFVHLASVLQPQLISDSEPDLSRLELGEVEPRNALLVQTHVPANDEALLSLGLLETLVVVGFDLDEGTEDVLVLVGVLVTVAEKGERGKQRRNRGRDGEVRGHFESGRRRRKKVSEDVMRKRGERSGGNVPKQNRLRLIIDTRLLQILQRRLRVLPPKLLELVDLVEGDLTSSKLFLLRRNLDEPREERAVFDERGPLRRVPDDILRGLHGSTGLTV
jgi:hypothetical protein